MHPLAQAVQQVELCHLVRLGDGGEVHHLVLLNNGPAKGAQGFLLAVAQGQTQAGQAAVQGFQHTIHISTVPLH